jgi:hypothetical protein
MRQPHGPAAPDEKGGRCVSQCHSFGDPEPATPRQGSNINAARAAFCDETGEFQQHESLRPTQRRCFPAQPLADKPIDSRHDGAEIAEGTVSQVDVIEALPLARRESAFYFHFGTLY